MDRGGGDQMKGRHVLATILLVVDAAFLLVPRLKDAVSTIPIGNTLLVIIGIMSLIVAFVLLQDDTKKAGNTAYVSNKK